METNISEIIKINNFAIENIKGLEAAIANYKFSPDTKNKAEFGNLCTALIGFRHVNDAMEAILANEDVLVSPDGSYYQKIKDEEPTPGSDYDVDKENAEE